MDTLTILLALATVGIPALTEAAVATTRLFGGTGADSSPTDSAGSSPICRARQTGLRIAAFRRYGLVQRFSDRRSSCSRVQ